MVLVWIYVTGVVMTGLLIMIVEEQERIYIPQKTRGGSQRSF